MFQTLLGATASILDKKLKKLLTFPVKGDIIIKRAEETQLRIIDAELLELADRHD